MLYSQLEDNKSNLQTRVRQSRRSVIHAINEILVDSATLDSPKVLRILQYFYVFKYDETNKGNYVKILSSDGT